MPSMAHEILVDLFKNRPSLAAEILVEVLGVSLPAYTEARLASTDLTEIQPAEYRADVVVLLLDGDIPVRVIIVEVQLAVDPRKRLSWPAYVTVSRAIHGCPADLLVVAPDPAVAAWCAEPIEIGVPGFVLRPPVLRRTAVPVVTDPAEAARRPELGVLSAHGARRDRAGSDDRRRGAARDPGARRRPGQVLLRSRVQFPERGGSPGAGGDDEGLRIPERFREEVRRAGRRGRAEGRPRDAPRRRRAPC